MPFELSVVTPHGQLLKEEVDEVTAPGVEGEFGVLAGHIPFISATRAGVLSWRRGGERGKLAVGPGFVEVSTTGVVSALMQRAARGDKIDSAAAEALEKEADGVLKKSEDAAERNKAQGDLEWAQAQLQALK